ncbi:hypothetical protein ACTA71_006650 [Dictyostelium dimigraforme]
MSFKSPPAQPKQLENWADEEHQKFLEANNININIYLSIHQPVLFDRIIEKRYNILLVQKSCTKIFYIPGINNQIFQDFHPHTSPSNAIVQVTVKINKNSPMLGVWSTHYLNHGSNQNRIFNSFISTN